MWYSCPDTRHGQCCALQPSLLTYQRKTRAYRTHKTEQREALVAAKLEEDKTIAREVRGKFVQELWGLAKEFRLREQEQAKADQLSKKLTRLEGVEAELREAERCDVTSRGVIVDPRDGAVRLVTYFVTTVVAFVRYVQKTRDGSVIF